MLNIEKWCLRNVKFLHLNVATFYPRNILFCRVLTSTNGYQTNGIQSSESARPMLQLNTRDYCRKIWKINEIYEKNCIKSAQNPNDVYSFMRKCCRLKRTRTFNRESMFHNLLGFMTSYELYYACNEKMKKRCRAICLTEFVMVSLISF